MYKLVVLFALVAAASAKPHVLAPAVSAYGVAPVVATYAAAAPAVATYAAAAPAAIAVESPTVLETRTSVGYAQGAALSKQVHYAPQPVVTGYSSSVIKPDLGAVATPLHSVLQQRVLAPSRAVHTITPQITQVQPELHIQKVAVDVPVHTPYVSEVEVVAKAAPVIAAPAVHAVAAAPAAVATYAAAAPAVATYAAAVPAVTSYAAPAVATYAAAPAFASYSAAPAFASYGAAPAFASYAAPAVTSYAAAAPALATYAAAAPAVATYAAGHGVATYAAGHGVATYAAGPAVATYAAAPAYYKYNSW